MIRRLFIYLLIIVGGGFVLLYLDKMNETEFRGSFRVIDGDTLKWGGQRLQLVGFDAPELGQQCGADENLWDCGAAAKRALQGLVDAPDFYCRGSGEDRYRRLLADCFSDNVDVGDVMVGKGMAVAAQGFLYRSQQANAKNGRIGLWAGPFDRPSDWRKLHSRAEMAMPLSAVLLVVRRMIGW